MNLTVTPCGEGRMVTAWKGLEPMAKVGVTMVGGIAVVHDLESEGDPSCLLAVVRKGLSLARRTGLRVRMTVRPGPDSDRVKKLYKRFGARELYTTMEIKS